MSFLEGRKCPKCGQGSKFFVKVAAEFEITNEGCARSGDVEYDDSSDASCPYCGWAGEWVETDEESSHFLVMVRRSGECQATYIDEVFRKDPVDAYRAALKNCERDWDMVPADELEVCGVIRLDDAAVWWNDNGVMEEDLKFLKNGPQSKR